MEAIAEEAVRATARWRTAVAVVETAAAAPEPDGGAKRKISYR